MRKGRGYMMKKGLKFTVLGLTVMAMSAGTFHTSGAAGIVDAETSIAGASFALDQFYINTETHDAVLALLFGGEAETQGETSETETTVQETAGATMYAVANSGNYVRVRSMPSTADDSTIIGKMYDGAVGTILETVDGEGGTWYHITSGSVEGYVRADLFIAGTEQDAFIADAFKTLGTVSANTTGLYVRSGPSVETDAITLIGTGTQVVITGEAGDFYQVQLDATCTGYVHKDYIDVVKTSAHAISLDEERILAEQAYEDQLAQSTTPAETVPETQPETAPETQPETAPAETAAPETQPVQTVPETQPETAATQAPVVAVGVQAGYNGGTKYVGNTVSAAELTVMGVFSDGSTYPVDGWGCAQVGVPLSEGANTFVVVYNGFETSFTVNAVAQQTAPAADQNAELRSALVNYAMQFLGNPYVYGGTDLVNGTDCSGFTSGVYAHFGMSITRTSRSQAAAGREIALSDVKVGDLVFYTNLQTGVIGHVAIYIGNGQIIHAASETLGIIVSDMYYRQPCKAVTFIG